MCVNADMQLHKRMQGLEVPGKTRSVAPLGKSCIAMEQKKTTTVSEQKQHIHTLIKHFFLHHELQTFFLPNCTCTHSPTSDYRQKTISQAGLPTLNIHKHKNPH